MSQNLEEAFSLLWYIYRKDLNHFRQVQQQQNMPCVKFNVHVC